MRRWTEAPQPSGARLWWWLIESSQFLLGSLKNEYPPRRTRATSDGQADIKLRANGAARPRSPRGANSRACRGDRPEMATAAPRDPSGFRRPAFDFGTTFAHIGWCRRRESGHQTTEYGVVGRGGLRARTLARSLFTAVGRADR